MTLIQRMKPVSDIYEPSENGNVTTISDPVEMETLLRYLELDHFFCCDFLKLLLCTDDNHEIVEVWGVDICGIDAEIIYPRSKVFEVA